MASIVMDVLTNIDERSAALGARKLEDQFKKSGVEAGESFGASLAAGMIGGFGKADFSSVTGILSSGVMTARAATAGNTLGAAYAAGIAGAAAVGIVAAAVKIGSAFEDINRQITLSTNATGGALEDLKSHADALVGSLDTTTKSLGTDMAVLAQRLHMEAGPALDQLTEHVEMLRDRFGQLNIQNLSAALVQFKVPAGEADNALASLTNSARAAGENVGQLIDSVAKVGDTLAEAGMSIGQSGAIVAQATEILGSPDKAVQSFGMALKAAAKEGESLEQFMPRVAASIQHYMELGDKANADAIANDVFGARKAVDAKRLVDDYMEVWRKGPDVYRANGAELTELEKKTATLENRWQQVRNKIEAALAPTALSVVDDVAGKMDEFIGFIDQHKEDLANLFKMAIDVIENTLTLLGEVASVLAKHPALVQAVATAFATWEAIKGVNAVVAGLKAISVTLGLLPAEAAAAGSGMLAALGPVAALAATIAGLFSMGGSAPGAAAAGGTPPSKQDATRGYAKAHGDQMPQGTAEWLAGKGPMPKEMAPYMNQASSGTPFFDAQGRPLDAAGQAWGGAPDKYAPGMPKSQAPPPPLAPGEAPPGTPEAGGPGEPALLTPGDLEGGGKGKKGKLPKEPEVPYGPGYGAPPAPGESPDAYRKQQELLERRHTVDEAQARLNQLEADNNATAEDIQKAKNKLLEAQSHLYESEEAQLGKHTAAMDEFGVKLDKDFGVSKGLAGIADNLVKFVAALAMAPAMGALGAVVQSSGVAGTGAKGLIGYGALSGAFGPEYMADGAGGPLSPSGGAGARGGGSRGSRSGSGGGGGGGGRGGWLGSMTRYSESGASEAGGGGAVGGAGGSPGPVIGSDMSAYGGGGVPIVQNPDGTWSSPNPEWQKLITRESGGRNVVQSGYVDANTGGNEAFGVFQITPGTWASHGGKGSVYSSSPVEQAIVAANILRGAPAGGDWGENIPGLHRENAGALLAGLGHGQADPDKPGYNGPMIPGITMPKGSYAQGGEIMIKAHEGEHVFSEQDVAAMGGQDEVYKFRSRLRSYDTGDAVTDPTSQIPGVAGMPAGGPYAKQSNPLMPTSIPPQMMPAGGSGATAIGGAPPPGGYGGGLPGGGGGAGGAATQGATAIGGSPPPVGAGAGASAIGGGAAAGAGAGAATMGIGIAAQIAMQEAQRAIQQVGTYAGIGVSALQQTFSMGTTKLSQGSWLNKIAGGLMGAQPSMPNVAGKHEGGSQPPGGPPPESALPSTPVAPPPGNIHSGDVNNTGVNIEHYHVTQGEDRAGADLSRHNTAGNAPPTGPDSR
jgi:hypothetical protein